MIVYLASQSPRRKEILTRMGIPFRVVRSRYVENALGNVPKCKPRELVLRHAIEKARQAKLPKRARYVLGADTVVWIGGHALGKPRSKTEAIRMLRMISGRKHQVFSAMALWDRKKNQMWAGCERTDVWVKSLGLKEIQRYLLQIHAYDKAGAYAIQCRPKIVKKIRGSYSNVVGFPRQLFRKILGQAGF